MADRRAFLKSLLAIPPAITASGWSPFAARALAQTGKPDFSYGVVLPLTGGAAPFGLDQVKAHMWAVQEINAAGGANGHKLNPIVLDSQGKPDVGVPAVTRLASVEKVPMFITAWSAVVAAVAPIANRNKVLELSVGANSPRISKLGDYVYTTYPLADVDVTLLAKYAYEKLGARKGAAIFVNDESGIYGAEVFRNAFRQFGGSVDAFESYEPTATDYTGAVLKLRAANPQVVHLHGNASDTPIALGQMRQLGINVPVTTNTAGYNPELIQKIGRAADGLIVATLAPGPKDNATVAKYVERWQREEKRIPNNMPNTQYVHDAAYVIKALVEHVDKAGLPFSGDTLRDALLKLRTFNLPLTEAVRIEDDHTVKKPVYLIGVKDGRFTEMGRYE
jgi:branched-chain amino acid transport system substrate-binding protein